MRIIGGEFKRRPLTTAPDASITRPMPARVRGAVFNLLRGHFEGAIVVDAFAGTGSVGLEALSRGAAQALFIERDRNIGKILRGNIERLGVEDRAIVVQGDALGPAALTRCPPRVHLVFFDPPYPVTLDAESRARLWAQFARFVARLDDDGFALLRTPWPARAPHPREDDEEALAEKGECESDIDLSIEGAEGPETHAYARTAVHLYMRARTATSAS